MAAVKNEYMALSFFIRIPLLALESAGCINSLFSMNHFELLAFKNQKIIALLKVYMLPNAMLISSQGNAGIQLATSAPPWMSNEARCVYRARHMFLKVSRVFVSEFQTFGKS